MKYGKITIVVAILIMMSLNGFATASTIGDDISQFNVTANDEIYTATRFEKPIIILYGDTNQQLFEMATGVKNFLAPFYSPVELYKLSSLSERNKIPNNDWIVVHIYETTPNGPLFASGQETWSQLAAFINTRANSEHILAIANARQASQELGPALSHAYLVDEQTEVADGKLIVIYAVWMISEILMKKGPSPEYQAVGKELQNIVLKFFAENVNDLLERSYDPKNPVGLIDEAAQQKRFEQMLDAAPRTAFYLSPSGTSIPLANAKSAALQNGHNLILTQTPSDLSVAEIPAKSGIEGPAGKVIDILLEILRNYVKYVELSPDVANKIKDIMQYIPKILGIIKDPSVPNILDLALDILTKKFPRFQEYREYIDLAIEGFYALRGEPQDIIAFALKMVKRFFPENSTIIPIAEQILNDQLADLITKLQGDEDAFKAIANWLINILTTGYINQTLSSWLGVSISEIYEQFKALTLLINTTLYYYQTQDTKTFILKTLPKVIKELKPFIDFVRSVFGKKDVTKPQPMSLSRDRNSIMASDVNSNSVAVSGILDTVEEWKQKLQPIIEIAKIVHWIAGKLGALKDSKAFLDEFPLEEVIDKFFEAIHIATNKTYPDIKEKVKEYAELVKGVLNGTITAVSIASDAIDKIVDSMTSLSPEYRDFIKRVLKFIIGKIADKNSSLRQIVQETLENFIQEGIDLFLSTLDNTTRLTIKKIMKFLIPGLVTIMSVLKASPALASITAKTIGLTPEEALEEAKRLSLEYLTNMTESIIEKIPDTILNATQKETLKEIAKEIPKLILSWITMSSDTETSWSTIIRQLGVFLIQVVMDKIREDLKKNGINDYAVFYFIQLAQSIFENMVEGKFDVDLPSIDEVVAVLADYLLTKLKDKLPPDTYESVAFIIKLLPKVVLFFQDGVSWIVNELKKWIAGILSDVLDELLGKLNAVFEKYQFYHIGGELPIGLGPFTLFKLTYQLTIKAQINFDAEGLKEFIISLLLDGKTVLTKYSDLGAIMKKLFSFLRIAPVFDGSLGVKELSTSEGGLLRLLFEVLGVNIEFSGSAHFSVLLFKLGANGFDRKSFFKVLEWSLQISILVWRDITIFDLFTAGVGGGFFGRIARYIGLDAIKLTIKFGITLTILRRAETPTKAAAGIASLVITVEAVIKFSVSLGIVKLSLYGGIRLLLTFYQDLLNKGQPLRIILRVLIILGAKLRIKIGPFKKSWSWSTTLEPIGPFDLSPKKPKEVKALGAMGYDTDYDGIPDSFERAYPGLNIGTEGSPVPLQPQKYLAKNGVTTLSTRSATDTDGDGLADKYELKYILTDPTIPDSDGDGLSDYEEVMIYYSNALEVDTDADGLSDYEEVMIFGTDPLNTDTDMDGLSDTFEITYEWNMTGITPSVTQVIIGGIAYTNKTDPLNPDTDNDLLLDGQEGPFGPYYGSLLSYDPYFPDVVDLVWNEGYTHPLDNDTDDDSYMQAYTGEILPSRIYLGDMRDGVEIRGITATIVENGDYVTRTFYTDPTRSDSDGDTGPGGPGVVMVSDGYELYESLTDPLSGDLDNDGLTDTFENLHGTDITSPDTDGDGLNDKLEVLMSFDPLTTDTDQDLLSDGEEYLTIGTNPYSVDTDFDGVFDGEEVLTFKTNPLLQDTDSDGTPDKVEVKQGTSTPFVDDSDNDGLLDRDERYIYGTDPLKADTDGDGLSDYDEVMVYTTNPLTKDTDGDSIEFLDPKTGQPILLWTDYDEVTSNVSSPFSPDTDSDGLLDSVEILLNQDTTNNITNLDPSNADSDGDGLNDGTEIQVSIIPINETFAIVEVQSTYNSLPDRPDTDFDGVDDWTEVMNGTRADYWDTDNDQLPDYDEYYVFTGISPKEADSDDDGIIDSLELLWDKNQGTYYHYSNVDFQKIEDSGINTFQIDPDIIPPGFIVKNLTIQYYNTYSWNPDTDGDMLPDGAELTIYQPNFPNFSPELGQNDTNNNGIIDGMDLDLDNDGLEDGMEFMGEYPTQDADNWGIFDPDVDHDTIPDGAEVYTFGTRPDLWDTDNDTYSDGFELLVGTDPLSYTTEDEMRQVLESLRGPLVILSPGNGVGYYNTTGSIPVVVFNITDIETAWYRVKHENSSTFGDNVTLSFYNESNPQLWADINATFDKEGVYALQAFVRTTNGSVFMDEIVFAINKTLIPGKTVTNSYYSESNGVIFLVVFVGTLSATTGTVIVIRTVKRGGG